MDLLLFLLAAASVAAILTVWAKIAAKWRLGLPLVAYEPRRPTSFGLIDLFVIAVGYVLTNLAILDVLRGAASIGAGEPPQLREAGSALVATSLTNLLTMGLAIFWLRLRTGATWADLGFRFDQAGRDLWLGLATFAAVSAPIYALQAFLSQFFSEQHPIIDVLQKNREPWLMALSGVSAVIVAPVAEEFFFRGLFQSWLDSLPIARALQHDSLEQSLGTQEEPRLAGPPDPNNPYSPAPSTAEAAAAEFLAGGDSADLPPAAHYRLAGVRWDHAALAVSSGVFALMHLGHGAAPIPLFFLALALGYLYQRTGRLLPSVTVHFCLNACSLAMLWSGLPVEIK